MNRYKLLLKNINLNFCNIILIVFLAIITSLTFLLVPYLIGESIDILTTLKNGWQNHFIRLLVIIFILYVISLISSWLSIFLSNKLANHISKNLRINSFIKLSKLPLSFFDITPKGEITSRIINDIEQIDEGLSQGLMQIVSSICSIIISIIFMLRLNFYVALSAILVVPLCFVTGYFITRFGRNSFLAQAESIACLSSYTDEIFNSFTTVRAFSYEKQAENQFKKINYKLYETGWRSQFASALVNPSTRFVNNTAYVLVGILSIFAVFSGDLTIGGIAALLSYTNSFSKPINELSAIMLQLQLAFTSFGRLLDFLENTEEKENSINNISYKIDGNVVFKNVDFSYNGQKKIINNFNLNVEKGKKIAIVGSTGSGKTTLVNLLMSFYELDNGSITIDGIKISTINKKDFRRNIGMVLQQTWLFYGTIRENLKYGNRNVSDKKMIEAAEKSQANLFIEKMKNGYDTLLDSNGENLSAGQKQLLCITRVMLMEPSMIIFDEATSNVDILTEKRIQKAISILMKNKTSFVIAHRLSTIKDSDLIIVLENGSIVEQGTHDELIIKNGYYSILYNTLNN